MREREGEEEDGREREGEEEDGRERVAERRRRRRRRRVVKGVWLSIARSLERLAP